MHVGTESAADASKAAQALASALPGIVAAAQPGACLASLNISSALSRSTRVQVLPSVQEYAHALLCLTLLFSCAEKLACAYLCT